ncbi:MAG: endolysin [Chaetfec virus UA24_244]|nr:MAG: endolysin [Chaetfec virus UA24_244]
MVPIKVRLCPPERYAIKCPYTRTPSRIVVHNTANDAPAENEISYMLNNDNEVSYHVAVDDKEIIQAIPFDRNAWASGDGHGVGNMEGIHIEICYSLSGGERFTKAERNAAEYIASLLKKYGWGMEKVTKHQDYDGKYCPHRTLDLGWGRFLKLVESFLKEDDKMLSYEEFKAYQERYEKERAKKPASSWAERALTFCKERRVMVGDKDGSMRPQANITRQEVAQVVLNLMGGGREPHDYAAEAWQKARVAGILDGAGAREPLTREQLAAVLDRLGLLDGQSHNTAPKD